MTKLSWTREYLDVLGRNGVSAVSQRSEQAVPVHRVNIASADWTQAAMACATMEARFAGIWADQHDEGCAVYSLYERDGGYLELATFLDFGASHLASLSCLFPAADRLERHMRDLLGVQVDDGDGRRWARHKAWQAEEFPLRSDFPHAGKPPRRTPSDVDYPFANLRGSSVYEIPVGPVHAGIIEPGHFRFQAVGEDVLRLEVRLGYVHKGIEKLAVGREPRALARLAARVSGDSTVSHAWAACQAMERAIGCPVPPRALVLRAMLSERERVANHIGDIGAICNDVGFSFAHVQCARLREGWQRRNAEVFGHRLLMDLVIPGGIDADIEADAERNLRIDHERFRRETTTLFDIIEDHPSLDDRLIGTGVLQPEDARTLGCTGFAGKASGQGFDVRMHAPYPPYDKLTMEAAVCVEGDVAARVRVRIIEIEQSLEALDRLLDRMPSGPTSTAMPAAEANAEGLGIIDSWRGEIVCFVRFDSQGRIARYFPRDPSWFSWPALERLIHGNIVPDFPVCNKSINASYSGHDL